LKGLIDWERFRPLFANLFFDDDKTGGRPHYDEVIMMRVLVLQRLYGLSDQETEFQVNDRTSFKNFLGFPEKLPDYSTIWRLKERMQKDGTLDRIWNELQRQLDAKGLKVKTGVIQDATFVEADFGKKRYQEEKKAKKEGREIEYTDKQKAHMDKDGTFAVKGQEVHFGYKLHQKSDIDFGLIRDFGVTTASTNDNQVDLVVSGDNAAYRDKGYAGTKLRSGVRDMTMKKAARNRPLTKVEKRFNRAVAKIRFQGERPFAVIQRVFNGGTTRVKNLKRVTVQQAIECFAFNLYQLFTLKRQGRF
ncbi:MAG: IS5 family transposase, partial [Candidatus Aenigmarchaeota archaeon]|nr:IS5 family transposase [Candidatus Aenigmarchaeota archaeon]MDI6722327.1 IS5 family transposase [Candidatus Aenigmarchaeota archaeon]